MVMQWFIFLLLHYYLYYAAGLLSDGRTDRLTDRWTDGRTTDAPQSHAMDPAP